MGEKNEQPLPEGYEEFAKLLDKVANLGTPDLKQKYQDAIKHLDDNYAYFLTHVLNIGTPKWSNIVPTAAVIMEKKAKADDFKFVFSPRFVKLLQLEKFRGDLTEQEAMSFILAHETMHILLNHLKLCQANRFSDKQKFNLAADAVINDQLVHAGFKPIPGLIYGDKLVGRNCANSTVTEVYEAIPPCPTCNDTGKVPDTDGQDDQNSEGTGGEQDQDGSEGGEGEGEKPCPDCQSEGQGYGRAIDDHSWMHDSTKAEQDAAEQASQNLPKDMERVKQDDERESGVQPGAGTGSAVQFAELNGVGLKWAELLKKIDPFVFKHGPNPRPAWHRRPRKLGAISPEQVSLPVIQKGKFGESGEKPAIVMALDTSGSIGEEQSNQFVNMARSIPQDRIELFVCTFTTQYQELDLQDPKWVSGGTAFDPIVNYIEDIVIPKNRRKYPSAVVVVTDGYADFDLKRPEGKEAKGWYWLLTEYSSGEYGGQALPGAVDKLQEYRREQ